MEYRNLGRSGLKVSVISIGAMTFTEKGWRSAGTMSFSEIQRVVDYAIDHGVNLFDTADIYAFGESETLLGKALGNRKNDVIIATKVRGVMDENDPNRRGLSRYHIIRSLDESLKRLGRDYIDIYQLHWWDNHTPIEETLETLNDLVREGKVRYIGLSDFAGWQIARSVSIQEMRGWSRFISAQMYYSLLGRDIEFEVVPACQESGLGLMIWSALAGGFLTGKYSRDSGIPSDGRYARMERPFLRFDMEKGYFVVDELRKIAEKYNATVSQVALNWVKSKPFVSSIIIGVRSLDQLKDNLGSVEWDLSEEDIEYLDQITQPVRPYPQWFLDMFADL
ncbi:MAG TPA: aldo/keto reductase [Persephonella sp.]|uniref:Aldo/keto reductase n=1 Tax=Persephonella marina (strain DSM 14350 / EX-H1) TaxID=123214 RepID=C0QQ25_PERMH|nr:MULTISPECIES: aldo/keto reductase [Persephonella]ACO04893.1 aldo/keto reductase [Persephonella marina EX-H1]HCB69614.1 aldo/keto reductase [Persephonella sp.]